MPRHPWRLGFSIAVAGIGAVLWLLLGDPFSRASGLGSDVADLLHPSPSGTPATVILGPNQIEAWEDPQLEKSARGVLNLPSSERKLSEIVDRNIPGWKRVRVLNSSDASIDWGIRVFPPLFEQLDLHVFDESEVEYHAASYRLGAAGEGGTLLMPMPGFRVPFRPGVSTLVFFSRAVDTEQATLFFDPIEKTFEEVGWQNALVGIYFGVLFALAVYNLLIYFALRVPFVGYYLIFMMSWAFISACLHGYINYVSGFALPFSLWVGPFTHLAIITGTLFTRSFLGTAVLAPKLDLYHRVVIALLVVFCLISMTPFDAYLIRWTSPGLELATLIQTLMVLITGMILMARGSKAARVFTLGFLVSVVGIVVTILTYRGILPQTNITRFAIQISSLFEMVFLAGAISLRLKQLASEQESLATERSERSRYQSLVGLAAHDLASPLSVIQLETELAERGGQMNWARIREAAEQQEQILNYIRKERIGGPESAPGVASLTFVPRVMESLLSRVAGRKGITLQLPESHEVAGLQVRMDSAILLNTVLRNLIENAIKFSPHGSSVKVSIEPKGSAWVKFSVTDAGIGMSKELLKQIESGASGAAVNRPGTDGERGTGMGLHLAWTMIRKAGGRMSVQSRTKEEGVSDSGTKFEFLLPVG